MMEDSDISPPAPDVGQIVRQPLNALDRIGIARPSGMTIEQYLANFVHCHLLSASAVSAWMALYEETRYAGRYPDSGVAREISQRLTDEILRLTTLDEQALAPLHERLQAPPPEEGGAIPSRPLAPADPEPAADDIFDLSPQQLPPPRHRLSLDNRIRLVGVIVAVWSVIMVTLGYSQAGWIHTKLEQARVYFLGRQAVPIEKRFQQLKEHALQHPYDRQAWVALADLAYANQQYTDAIVASRYLVSLSPEDPDLLNSLAWLLATAEEADYRRPREALELAEKAYKLDQSPHIADTLAEACWLNGDAKRAEQLERQAVLQARDPQFGLFYQRQLHKFRTESPPPLPEEPPLTELVRPLE